jgi:hypothetical protein
MSKSIKGSFINSEWGNIMRINVKSDLENLISQLEYAVKSHNGKTTITQSDIDTMIAALKHLPDRYALRYTHDLAVAKTCNSNWLSLIPASNRDNLMHIIDTSMGEIMWQNGMSQRYGSAGLAKGE